MQDVGNMLKMKFWFEGNQLQPDCNIHGGCKIGSSACHACPHCVRVNSKDQEVLCLGDGSGYKEVKLEELRVGDRFKAVKTTAKVHEDGRLEILKSERIGRTCDISKESRDRIIEELKNFKLNGDVQQLERPDATY